ncbi:MAG: hypothetical protein M1376_11165 [Planctomycetes bacterium]|nr:hypothetical protein [Planctomycetota bacterium]
MASKVLPGCVVASLLLAVVLPAWVEAQPYGGPGSGFYGPSAPGTYPYGDYGNSDYYGYPYFPFPGFFYPYASRYLPSYSYTPSPYMQVPGAAAYGTPPFAYSPFAYTYDLYAQSYADAYAGLYPYYPPYAYYAPPAYPYGPYHRFIPRRPRFSPYRPMTLEEYFYRESQGPTRVRDIVPGVPELGG